MNVPVPQIYALRLCGIQTAAIDGKDRHDDAMQHNQTIPISSKTREIPWLFVICLYKVYQSHAVHKAFLNKPSDRQSQSSISRMMFLLLLFPRLYAFVWFIIRLQTALHIRSKWRRRGVGLLSLNRALHTRYIYFLQSLSLRTNTKVLKVIYILWFIMQFCLLIEMLGYD